MQTIKNPALAQLFMETSFVPKSQRLKQLSAAEELYRIVESGREYPYEFICFKITGYRPKSQPARQAIAGAELLRDLPVYALRTSARLKLSARGQNEKIYSIDELAEKFNVSIRTIERWRKKGLLCRKYLFDGNVLQLGFRESVVNEFASANPQLVASASKFSTIPPAVKRRITEMAQKLDSEGASSRTATIKKVASHFKRAKETIRLIIIDAEKNQRKQIFKKSGVLLGPREAAAVYNMYESGSSVNQIAEKFNKSASSIYRVINRRRIRKLLSAHVEYITSPEFVLPDAEQKILSPPMSVRRMPKGILDKTKNASEANWQEFVDTIQKIPMLNRQQEFELFRRYNFLKYLAFEKIHNLSLTAPCAKAAQQAEQYLSQAERIKNMIVEANLKLVIRVAGRHTAGANFTDLISEGNIALLRAVEKFDYARGFRFSTYAVWVIAREFARFLPAEAARTERSFSHDKTSVEHSQQYRPAGIELIEMTRKSLEQIMEDNLTEREQYVIRYHFGLTGSMVKKKFKTLKQLGDELNLSKERVRQIELIALGKLRQTLSPEEFELLTG